MNMIIHNTYTDSDTALLLLFIKKHIYFSKFQNMWESNEFLMYM